MSHARVLSSRLRDAAPSEGVADAQILEASVTEDVLSYVRDILTGNDKQQAEKLVKGIAGIVDLSRNDWPLGFIRTLADEVASSRPGFFPGAPNSVWVRGDRVDDLLRRCGLLCRALLRGGLFLRLGGEDIDFRDGLTFFKCRFPPLVLASSGSKGCRNLIQLSVKPPLATINIFSPILINVKIYS